MAFTPEERRATIGRPTRRRTLPGAESVMLSRPQRFPVKVLLAAAVLLGGLVVALLWRTGRAQDWLAGRLGHHLQSVPDERVEVELQQLAQLDGIGLLVVVDSLASPRRSVAHAAGVTLEQQLDRWRGLPREQSSRAVGALAHHLARRVHRWPAAARGPARDLALRILDWPVDGRVVERAALIADCQQVLSAPPADAELTASAPDDAQPAARRPDTDASTSQAVSYEVRGATRRPDGEPALITNNPTSNTSAHRRPVAEDENRSLETSADTAPVARAATAQEPHLLPASGDLEAPPDAPPSLIRDAPLAAPPVDADASDAEPDWKSLPDRALMSFLVGNGEQASVRAEQILAERGYQPLDLQLARRLVSPDAAARRQMVDWVGRLPTGAGRWLLWLSQDADAGVRQAVVSLMLTAQDPRIVRRLMEMEISDPDQEIRNQLRQWRATSSR